jgi:hypothetical protein
LTKNCNNLTKILKLIWSLNIHMTSSSDNAIQFGHVHPHFFSTTWPTPSAAA